MHPGHPMSSENPGRMKINGERKNTKRTIVKKRLPQIRTLSREMEAEPGIEPRYTALQAAA